MIHLGDTVSAVILARKSSSTRNLAKLLRLPYVNDEIDFEEST